MRRWGTFASSIALTNKGVFMSGGWANQVGIIAQMIVAILAATGVAFWVALAIWTFRDISARTRDPIAILLATLLGLLFGPVGVLLYLLLRPKETLAERYDRALEEEALLREIEDLHLCPGCRRPTKEDWIVCPYCHTPLRRPCPHCGRLIDLSWDICPYCGVEVVVEEEEVRVSTPSETPPEPLKRPATESPAAEEEVSSQEESLVIEP